MRDAAPVSPVARLLEPRSPSSAFHQAADARRDARRAELDRLAPERERWLATNAYYHASVADLLRFLVPEGASVLEIGCGTGDLLAALRPSRGVGVDLSPGMLAQARARHPGLTFKDGDAEQLDLGGETFDAIVLSDVVGYLDDVWTALRRLHAACRPETRIVITLHNSLWEPILDLAERFSQKMPQRPTSWLQPSDVENLLHLNHFEVVSQGSAVLMPKHVPLLSAFANRVLAQVPGLRRMNLVQYLVARPTWRGVDPVRRPLTTSIVIPTRNEHGNIADIFERTPDMGPSTELIFVDGRSSDGTVEEIERLLPTRPGAKLLRQTGKGKGDAVRLGFAAATGDVLFILDSDLTVPPEDLPKFYLAVAEGRGEFVNGTRLVYPMEDQAMRFLNLLGNQFFSVAMSWILGQTLKDTLCGTKVLTRRDYEKVVAGRAYFGDFDPFGDFDLIFGAAKLNLKIVEVPIRYRARTYGDTKISRFSHGFLLLRMTALALWKFKMSRAIDLKASAARPRA
jgi:SAM-dependent methyltransferase